MTATESTDFFDHTVRVWEKAQVVTDAYMCEPIVRFDEVVAHPELFHDKLVSTLSHKSQLVVAYCLFALDKMKSPALNALSEALLTHRGKVTVSFGSFATSSDLGGIARQLRKKYASKA